MRANKGIGRKRARQLRLEREVQKTSIPYSSQFWIINRARGGYLYTGLQEGNYRPVYTWEVSERTKKEAKPKPLNRRERRALLFASKDETNS